LPEKVDGISFLPILRGERPEKRPFLYRELPAFGGQQAVWWGKWKGARMNLSRNPPDRRIELYNLERDPGEERDVAVEHPAVVSRIEEIMWREHRPSEVFLFPALDDPPVETGGETAVTH
jgi:arylsulfatase